MRIGLYIHIMHDTTRHHCRNTISSYAHQVSQLAAKNSSPPHRAHPPTNMRFSGHLTHICMTTCTIYVHTSMHTMHVPQCMAAWIPWAHPTSTQDHDSLDMQHTRTQTYTIHSKSISDDPKTDAYRTIYIHNAKYDQTPLQYHYSLVCSPGFTACRKKQ